MLPWPGLEARVVVENVAAKILCHATCWIRVLLQNHGSNDVEATAVYLTMCTDVKRTGM